VAQEGDRVAGFYPLTGPPPEGELACRYIEPDHIGSGAGRRPWHHAVDTARALGFDQFTLDADPFAENFYRKMGAVRIGSIPGRLLSQLVYRLSFAACHAPGEVAAILRKFDRSWGRG